MESPVSKKKNKYNDYDNRILDIVEKFNFSVYTKTLNFNY